MSRQMKKQLVKSRRVKKRLLKLYRQLYFGHFRCARALRLDRYLHTVLKREIFFVKSGGCHVVYHPIPKTGCSTTKSLLLDACGYPLPDSGDVEDIHRITARSIVLEESGNYMKRETVRLEDNHFDWPRDWDLPDDAFHFTFVRNPWARLLSCYANKVAGQRPSRFTSFASMYPRIKFEEMTFPDFVTFACRVPDDLCEPHFRPQSDFVDEKTIGFIGRIEHFAEDISRIITRAGLDRRLIRWGTAKTNVGASSNQPYTDFYTAETRSQVAQKYAEDVERFGYRFGD